MRVAGSEGKLAQDHQHWPHKQLSRLLLLHPAVSGGSSSRVDVFFELTSYIKSRLGTGYDNLELPVECSTRSTEDDDDDYLLRLPPWRRK